MKLNVYAAIIAERLLNKSFAEFDFTNEETAKIVIYSMYVADGNVCTVKEFENIRNINGMESKLSAILKNELDYLAQFSRETSDEIKDVPGEDNEKKVSIAEMAFRLSALWGSHDYIMNKMKLWELEGFLKASEKILQEDMEEKRFWAYLNLSPHFDGKKIKKPSDILEFPWEAEQREVERRLEAEKGMEIFNKFFNSKPLES